MEEKNAINQRIQALESELAGLKIELKKYEKLMFTYSNKRFNIGNFLEPIKQEIIPNNYSTTSLNYRQLESNAKADFQLQKELMCIGALAEQIDPDYSNKVDWSNDNYKYYIAYDMHTLEYITASNTFYKRLGVVYMPKDVAEKVCEILNNKGVEL
jgi:hypothetical protein